MNLNELLWSPWTGRPPGRGVALAIAIPIGFVSVAAGFMIARPDVWTSVVVANAVLCVTGFATMWPLRRELFAIDPFKIALGVLAAGILYAGSWIAMRVGPAGDQVRVMFQWSAGHSPFFIVTTLIVAVLGEELFWRGTITRLLAERMPRIWAVLIGACLYAVAHFPSGHWMLPVAALGAGMFWGFLYIYSRSLVASLVCHYLWDVLILLVAPPV